MSKPRLLGSDDVARLELFLAQHPHMSMYLRSSLRDHGIDGQDKRFGARFWAFEDHGEISGVFGVTNGQWLHLQLSTENMSVIEQVRQALRGEDLRGVAGDGQETRAFLACCGITADQLCSGAGYDPHYHLKLSELLVRTPAHRTLHRVGARDVEGMTLWRADFLREAMGSSGDTLLSGAAADVARWIKQDRLRLLKDNNMPVCMTAFNAALPDIVQIGGVYTPPMLRGKGYARDAVALHLQEARRGKVRNAVLSASGPPACRAYEAIGFERIGTFGMMNFETPVTIT